MTRLGFILLPATLITLGACAGDVVPSDDIATSEDGLRACSTATTRTLHEYFEECMLGNARWVLCGANGPGVNDYFRDFEPQDRAVACNNFCQSVHTMCPDYSATGTLGLRRDWQDHGLNRRKRGYETTCSCRARPEASPVFSANGHVYYQNANGHFCHFPDPSYVSGLAPGEPVVALPAIPPSLVFDGFCHPLNRAFITGGGIFYENDARHYCHFTTMESYERYLGNGGPPGVALDQVPPGAVFDGPCP